VLHFQLDNGHPAETVETPDTPPLFGVSPFPTQEASLIGAASVPGQQKANEPCDREANTLPRHGRRSATTTVADPHPGKKAFVVCAYGALSLMP